jgi:cytidylate kinase
MQNAKIIIAIDGHSSCGKSTLAKQLAARLHYKHIDSGAMYRAVTLFALQNQLITNQSVQTKQLIAKLPEIHISFTVNFETQKTETLLNGENVENEIRSMHVSEFVSPVSAIKEIRTAMVKLQQKMAANKGIVMEGRDIGTVVFPEAELKIFMTASPEIRAKRRFNELINKGMDVSYTEILRNLTDRDQADSQRKISPLKKASDSILLDNSNLSHKQQLDWAYNKAIHIINKLSIHEN